MLFSEHAHQRILMMDTKHSFGTEENWKRLPPQFDDLPQIQPSLACQNRGTNAEQTPPRGVVVKMVSLISWMTYSPCLSVQCTKR